ncbi:hypothetical protein AVEN_202669-1 [Araneus ventricosus]|uniref:Uncharacterized protein n=1 Tax=Araneus ventricosus TaxID=182803 RepID=A0A4Y2X6W5_ARAVE|nr:hypothetical protein AVEN_71701-1 [Araneus ventricosus]GBO45312.1 hypothetical protein AVEN_202669-1 [Araneus ventricosus]
MKRSLQPNLAITKRRGNFPCRVVTEELSKKIPAEDESVALHLDGEVTEDSDQENDFETDLEDNPFHEEYSGRNSNTNVSIIHSIYNLIIP